MVQLYSALPNAGQSRGSVQPAILVEDLRRYFKVRIQPEGIMQGLKSFFNPEYRVIKAVDGISFSVMPGESVGYIGLNGAGKSTTIKLLSGVLVPTGGKVLVRGMEPFKNRKENAMHIGLMMGQRTQLLWDLPVRESFLLLGKVYEIPNDVYSTNVALFRELLDIGNLWDTPARMLSLGQRIRCDLALTFLHGPEVVYLDEPTIGLDVFARDSIRAFLKEMKSRGVTIFLASHDLKDLEMVADRVMLLHKGQVLFEGTQDELRDHLGGKIGSLEDAVRRFYEVVGS